jgi:hydrogenase nickel incorporation protein HypB
MFRAADIVIITKSDLLLHVDFSIDRCLGNMRAVNRSIGSFVLSAITGDLRTFPARASNPIVIVPGFA